MCFDLLKELRKPPFQIHFLPAGVVGKIDSRQSSLRTLLRSGVFESYLSFRFNLCWDCRVTPNQTESNHIEYQNQTQIGSCRYALHSGPQSLDGSWSSNLNLVDWALIHNCKIIIVRVCEWHRNFNLVMPFDVCNCNTIFRVEHNGVQMPLSIARRNMHTIPSLTLIAVHF